MHQVGIFSAPILWEHSINRKVENMIAVTLGEKVVLLRKERKWSQEDLEEYSRISRTQIGRIERDETNPSWTTLRKLETAFDLPYGSILMQGDLVGNEEAIVHEMGKALTSSKLNKSQLEKVAIIIDMIVGIAEETK